MFLFEGGKLIPFVVAEQALNWFSEFVKGIAIPFDPPASSGNIQTASAWVPQQGENIKINCDAAVKGAASAFGCVIRNSAGSVLECFGSPIPVSSVAMAEALAIREACLFCSNAGLVEIA